MASDALGLWDAISPMVKSTIDKRTRDKPRMEQMVVRTAYNSTTKKIGVSEPFGDEIFLPVYGGLDASALQVGQSVWVLSPYSSLSNGLVFMRGDGGPNLLEKVSQIVSSAVLVLNNRINDYWQTIYPVGSVYMSLNSTSPQTLFGGKWLQIKDRFLLGVGDTYTPENTKGGEADHTLTESELPQISGSFQIRNTGNDSGTASSATGNVTVANTQSTLTTLAYDSGNSQPTQEVALAFGSGNAHNNMPPYETVYMWKRIPDTAVYIEQQPEDIVASVGDTVSFHVEAYNVESYKWQYSITQGSSWANSGGSSSSDTFTFTISNNTVNYWRRCKMVGLDGNTVYSDVVKIIQPT